MSLFQNRTRVAITCLLIIPVLGGGSYVLIRKGTRMVPGETLHRLPSPGAEVPAAVPGAIETRRPPELIAKDVERVRKERFIPWKSRQDAISRLKNERRPEPDIPRPSQKTSVAPSARPPGTFQVSSPPLTRNADGSLAYRGSGYGATLGDGFVSVIAPAGRDAAVLPELAFILEDVRVGGKILAEGGARKPEADDKSRSVHYVRGVVEEIYLFRDEGLEQTFVIRELPVGRGELTVTGMVSTGLTPPLDGTKGARLSFREGEREVLAISDAMVTDADGNRLALELSYSSGKVAMTIPAEWIAQATLPITVDPLIGTLITVDSFDIGSSNTQRGADVAYNSSDNEFLVIWHDRDQTSGAEQVLGQRVSATGILLGSQLFIGTPAAFTYNDIAISYAPAPVNRYLVSWSGGPGGLVGIVLNPDGSPFGSTFSIFTEYAVHPAVAWDGTNWYVIGDNASTGNILGGFVSSSGAVGSRADASTEGTAQNTPSVAFTNGTYIIAWRKWDSFNGYSLMARTMNPSGTFLTSPTLVGAPPVTHTAQDIFVSGGGGKFLISWVFTSSGDIKLQGRVFDTSLAAQTNAFTIKQGTQFSPLQDCSAYSASNNEWYSVWFDQDALEIKGTRVGPTGTVATSDAISSNNVTDYWPRLSWNSATNEMLIVWVAGSYGHSTIYWQVFARRYDMAPLPAPTNFAGTAQSTTSIQWSWSSVTGATGYVVHDDNHNVIGTVGAVLAYLESNLTDNFRASRHVHALATNGQSGASNTAVKYTKIHDATIADFTMSVISSTQIDVVVTAPPNGSSGSTGCKIERQNGTKWTLLQNFAPAYLFHDTGRSANTSYTYRITFQNGDAIASAISLTQSVTTSAPAVAPTGLVGAAQSSTSIQWTWNEILGETGYNVYDTANALIGTTSANVHTLLESTGLVENLQYTRYVKAFNGVGSGPASSNASRYTLVHDAQIGDFNLAVASTTQINITVTPPVNNPTFGLTGCLIQRSSDNVNWTLDVKPFSNVYSCNNSPLTPGATYYYRIQYRNVDGLTSGFSPSQSRTTSLVPVITTPNKKTKNPNTTISGTGIVGSLVTVYFNNTPETGQATVNASGTWSYAVATKPEGTYTVYARATQGGSPSGNSNSITVTIDTTAPAPPSNVRLACYNNTIDVLWDPSPTSDVAGYQVSRKVGAGGTWTILNTTQLILGNQYRDSSATNGQQYFYRVTAVDDARSD